MSELIYDTKLKPSMGMGIGDFTGEYIIRCHSCKFFTRRFGRVMYCEHWKYEIVGTENGFCSYAEYGG